MLGGVFDSYNLGGAAGVCGREPRVPLNKAENSPANKEVPSPKRQYCHCPFPTGIWGNCDQVVRGLRSDREAAGLFL